jgi:hypothetical protein
MHLCNEPLLFIQAGKFGFDGVLSAQDLRALGLEIVHIDRFGQIDTLSPRNIFPALGKRLLVGMSLALQRILLGRRPGLLSRNFSGNQRGVA